MLFNSEVVLAPRTTKVRVVVDPARSLMNSLSLLNLTELRSGLSEWVRETVDDMPADLQRRNEIAAEVIDMIKFPETELEFPAFINYIEQLDLADAPQKRAQHLAEKTGTDAESIMNSRESFLRAFEILVAQKGEECNWDIINASYDYIVDPEKGRRFLVEHLTTMWERYLKVEWERVRPILQETAAAFDQLDLTDLTPLEAIQLVTGRDMTEFWHNEDDPDEIIFVPCTHGGPYMSQWGKDDKNRIYIIYGARMPEGVSNTSTELSLRDLLVQFTALADDTRLHIMSLLTQHRELRSQDFQQMLNLSQSAASRHLRQLVATGYLDERRRDLNKYFSLNQRRIHETATAMRMLLVRK